MVPAFAVNEPFIRITKGLFDTIPDRSNGFWNSSYKWQKNHVFGIAGTIKLRISDYRLHAGWVAKLLYKLLSTGLKK
jgi:hypothetical protein